MSDRGPHLFQYQGKAEPVFVPVAAEDIFVDKWYQPASEPVRKVFSLAAVVAATTLVEPVAAPALPEDWRQPTQQPTFVQAQSQADGFAFVEVLEAPFDWHLPTQEPIRVQSVLLGEGTETIEVPAVAALPDFDWYVPLQEPTRAPPGLLGEGAETIEAPAAVLSAFDWWVTTQQPVFLAPRPVDEGGMSPTVLEPSLFIIQNLDWMPPTNQYPGDAPRPVDEGWKIEILDPTVFVEVVYVDLPDGPNGPIVRLYNEDVWGAVVEFEVNMRAISGTVFARVVDTTTGSAVPMSTVSTSSTTFDRIRTPDNIGLNMTTLREYKVQVGKPAGASGEILTADLIHRG